MSPDLEDDYATASSEDIEAACEMFDRVADGSFYPPAAKTPASLIFALRAKRRRANPSG